MIETFVECFPDTDESICNLWVCGDHAWYKLDEPPHEGYEGEFRGGLNTLRIGELVKAFLSKNPKSGYDKMVQMVSKRADTLWGKQAAGKATSKERQARTDILMSSHMICRAIDDASTGSKRVDSEGIISDLLRDAGSCRGEVLSTFHGDRMKAVDGHDQGTVRQICDAVGEMCAIAEYGEVRRRREEGAQAAKDDLEIAHMMEDLLQQVFIDFSSTTRIINAGGNAYFS